jgi:hypothetical protein
MSSLTYRSKHPVPDSIRLQLQREAESLAPREQWWAESMVFFESPEWRGHLLGDSNIMLLGYQRADGEYVTVEPSDDMLMAYRSARFLVSVLKRWSRLHGIQWELEFAEFPFATIRWGFLSVPGFCAFAAAGAFVRIKARVFRLGPEIRRITAAHAGRW